MTVALSLAWSAHARPRWLRAMALGGVPIAVSVAYLTYSRTTAICVVAAAVAVLGLSLHRWTTAAHAVVAAAGSALIVRAVRAQPEIAAGTGTDGASIVALTVAGVVALCFAAGYGLPAESLDAVRVRRRGARRLIAAVAAVAIVCGIVVGPAVASSAWDSFRTSGAVSGSDPAARLGNLGGPRYELYGVVLDNFGEHPLGGRGAGTFEFTWLQDRTSTLFVRDGHSLYLESLAEVGLPGTLLVLLAVGALLVGAVRASLPRTQPAAFAGAASGAAAAFLVWVVVAGVDWMWESTAVTAAGVVTAAIAVNVGARHARPVRAPTRAAVAAVLLLGLLAQIPLLVSSLYVKASQESFARGDAPRALEAATTAVEAQPWAATPLIQRALVLEAEGDLAAASLDARAATRREPANWRTWIVLARIEAQRQRIRSALGAAERARRLNPRSPLWAPSEPPASVPDEDSR
jgi:O-antigen ligase